jgi:TolB-like protein
MFTDVVGFTALMGENEEKALRYRRINREIHQQKIEEAGGTWLKEMGDGTMASFASITEALQAAIEIRKICKQEMNVELKVGIHFGEVTNEDNDVFGDGVNIAARIEALAAGGGIVISETVYRDIKNKTDFKTAFIGETTLKNVAGKHKIYQVLDRDLVKPTVKIKTNGKRSILIGMAAILVLLTTVSYLIWPALFIKTNTNTSIAVLPFHSQSEDEGQKHYGVGLATEIRSRLSQSKQFEFISSMQATMGYDYTDPPAKIGDELDVQYILSGIYQISGERIKVDVELVDTQTGGIVWNLSFNELFTDIFELQSRIASKVFNEFSIMDTQREDVPTQSMEAYAHYLRGLELEVSTNRNQRRREAEEQLGLAIQKDSSFMDPYVSLVRVKSGWIFFNRGLKGTNEYDSVQKEVMDLRDYAKVHFSGSPQYTLILGFITYIIDQNYEEAQKLFEKVLAHDPENFDANSFIGSIYKRKLMHKEAMYHLTKARKLDPGRADIWEEIMIVFLNMGDYSSAEKAYHNGAILGMERDQNMFYEQGKTRPGQKEKDPLGYFIDKKFFERDFAGIIDMLDTTKMLDLTDIAFWKALSYYGLGVQDSVKHYGQFFLDQTGRPQWFIDALLGNREKVIEFFHGAIGSQPRSEKMNYCGLRALEIGALAGLGDYEEATESLIKLNREYPEYGRYGGLFSHPLMDKIKRESPAFVQALNNLKLPPKLDLEGRSQLGK